MGIAGIRNSGKRPDFTPIDEYAPLSGQRQEFDELRESIDLNNARKELDMLKKELRGAERVIDDLRATVNIAQHDAFKAEVEMRRAQQKRRNQKLELKRLHNAVNERNNRIRNLELEIGLVRENSKRQIDMIRKQHDEISGLRVMNVRAE